MNGFLKRLLLKERSPSLEIRPRLVSRYERTAPPEDLGESFEITLWEEATSPAGGPEGSAPLIEASNLAPPSPSGSPETSPIPAPSSPGREGGGEGPPLMKGYVPQLPAREGVEERFYRSMGDRQPKGGVPAAAEGHMALTARVTPSVSTEGLPPGGVEIAGGERPHLGGRQFPHIGEDTSPGGRRQNRGRTETPDAGDDLVQRRRTESFPIGMLATEMPRTVRRGERPIVRVTIGRVEVRAQTEKKPAPVATAPKRMFYRPPMTLEDYLKKRSKGA